jgi:hypothetical protein
VGNQQRLGLAKQQKAAHQQDGKAQRATQCFTASGGQRLQRNGHE